MAIEHGMLLDGKKVMDNALPDLHRLYELVAKPLHKKLSDYLTEFEEALAECDVSDRYEEKS